MKGDMLVMNGKERQRKAMMEAIKNKHFTLSDVAERLGITKRQVRRILRQYEKEGDKGLIHRHRGKSSNHTYDSQLKSWILNLYRTKYRGFGPTFAAEKITEEGYVIHPETLRIWLKAEGLWDEKRKRSCYRKQRKRKEQFGELLQLDGSLHCWFGENEPSACLMNLVDDSTGMTMALMDKEETTEAAMRVLKKWIERYGVPKSIYVDLKTVYISKTHRLNDEEPNGLTIAFTHFSRACDKLGIKIIKAYSPQAKGRVERKHGVFQDRFVKELQLRNIKTLSEANVLLDNYFLKQINKKFTQPPANLQDAHRDKNLFGDLEQIFCWEYIRQVQNDWTIRYKAKYYQLHKNRDIKLRAKQKIIVRQHLDQSVSLWQGENRLTYEEIVYKLKPEPVRKRGHDPWLSGKRARENKHKTPWSQYNPAWLKPKRKLENERLSTV